MATDFKSFLPKSSTEEKWLNDYIAEMGESKFWHYKNQIYNFLNRLEVGQFLTIEKLVKLENIDLFMKIAYCYVLESKGCYLFKNDYTQIKRYWDAREMDRTLELFKKQREYKNSETNGSGVERESERIEPVPS